MAKQTRGRRQLIAGLGTTAAAVALGGRASAQAPAAGGFEPARHAEDDWFVRPARHRVILDTVSPAGLPDAIRFAGNLFTGNKNGYNVEDKDVAIVVCLRHRATAFGYTDAIWSKYSKAMIPEQAEKPSVVNPYNTTGRMQLADLAKRGVQFMVCGTASRGLATRAAGPNGDVEAVLKELRANLLPNAQIVAAGVVGVTHAQERGYTYLYVG